MSIAKIECGPILLQQDQRSIFDQIPGYFEKFDGRLPRKIGANHHTIFEEYLLE
jgi:hypothetical protein